MKRSGGLTTFGILFIFFSIVGLLSTIGGVALLKTFAQFIASQSGGVSPTTQTILRESVDSQSKVVSQQGSFEIVRSVLGLVIGVGILMLQNWARWLTLILAGFSVVGTVGAIAIYGGSIFGTGSMGTGSMAGAVTPLFYLGWIVWNVIVLWYFLKPSVKTQFMKLRAGA